MTYLYVERHIYIYTDRERERYKDTMYRSIEKYILDSQLSPCGETADDIKKKTGE